MKALIICTGESVKNHIDEIKKLKVDFSIGVHNMAGMFEPTYNLFVSKKRYNKYCDIIPKKTMAVLSRDIKPKKGSWYNLFNFKNKYPSAKGELEYEEWVGSQGTRNLHIIGEGLSGGTAALAYACYEGAKEVWYVGLDGYSKRSHHFYKEKDNDWDRLMQHESATEMILKQWEDNIKIRILTPTVYKRWYEPKYL